MLGVNGLMVCLASQVCDIFHLSEPADNESVDLKKSFKNKHLGAVSLSSALLSAARRGLLSATA